MKYQIIKYNYWHQLLLINMLKLIDIDDQRWSINNQFEFFLFGDFTVFDTWEEAYNIYNKFFCKDNNNNVLITEALVRVSETNVQRFINEHTNRIRLFRLQEHFS